MRLIAQAAGYEADPVLACHELTEAARDLLSRLLDVDEGRRITVEDAAQHSWFHSGARQASGASTCWSHVWKPLQLDRRQRSGSDRLPCSSVRWQV